MFKCFLKIFIVIGFIMSFFSGSAAAESLSYDFIFSESASNIAMPRFDLSFGTLNSVTYSINDMTLGSTVIFDLDDNSGSLSLNNAFAGHTIGVGPIGSPIFASLFQMQRNVSGNFIGYDDGDGTGIHDGGNDEVISTGGFLNYSGTKSFTDLSHLDALSGSTTPLAFVGPIMNLGGITYKIGEPSRTIETYFEDITYSGNFTVTYDYTPVAPEPISSILFITGGVTLGFRGYIKRRRT